MEATIKINPNELNEFIRQQILNFANVDKIIDSRVIVDMADTKYPFKGYEVEVILKDN